MNKIIIFILLALLCIHFVVAENVKIVYPVNDYANIIDANTEQQLTLITKQLMDTGIAEYSIVTVNSLEGQDIFSYSLDLAQGKLGNTETDNGLLLLVALEDRKYQFQVGRGLEYVLNDAKIGRIGRTYLVSNFQEGNYNQGILEASLSIQSILLEDIDSNYYVQEPKINPELVNSLFSLISFIIFFIAIMVLSKKGKSKSKYHDAALAAVILLGGGRRGGGFGGSGGFGGFGGGGFGGGGAGGSF
jgi:uncharacterized protein